MSKAKELIRRLQGFCKDNGFYDARHRYIIIAVHIDQILSEFEQDEKKIAELEAKNEQMKSTLRFTATRLEKKGEGHREIDYVLKQSEALKGGSQAEGKEPSKPTNDTNPQNPGTESGE